MPPDLPAHATPSEGSLRLTRSGAVAEWLRSGLQSRSHRFDSGRRLSTRASAPGLQVPAPALAGSVVLLPHRVTEAAAGTPTGLLRVEQRFQRELARVRRRRAAVRVGAALSHVELSGDVDQAEHRLATDGVLVERERDARIGVRQG